MGVSANIEGMRKDLNLKVPTPQQLNTGREQFRFDRTAGRYHGKPVTCPDRWR